MKATPAAITVRSGTRLPEAAERGHRGPEAGVGARRPIDHRLVSLIAPASFEADRYRALRSHLESSRAGRRPGVIAVTSAVVGDGKTTTSINLAAALAQGRDTRVLL